MLGKPQGSLDGEVEFLGFPNPGLKNIPPCYRRQPGCGYTKSRERARNPIRGMD